MGLGAYVATQAVKTALPWPMQGWTKLATVFLAALTQGFLRSRNPVNALVRVAIPATGFAVVTHRAARKVQTSSDLDITKFADSTVERRTRSARPAVMN